LTKIKSNNENFIATQSLKGEKSLPSDMKITDDRIHFTEPFRLERNWEPLPPRQLSIKSSDMNITYVCIEICFFSCTYTETSRLQRHTTSIKLIEALYFYHGRFVRHIVKELVACLPLLTSPTASHLVPNMMEPCTKR
jgi:hypothetical protein